MIITFEGTKLAINVASGNCDAKRPCTGCKKAHAAVIAQAAMNDLPFDKHPTCTYDDSHINNVNVSRAPTVAPKATQDTSSSASPNRAESPIAGGSGASAVPFASVPRRRSSSPPSSSTDPSQSYSSSHHRAPIRQRVDGPGETAPRYIAPSHPSRTSDSYGYNADRNPNSTKARGPTNSFDSASGGPSPPYGRPEYVSDVSIHTVSPASSSQTLGIGRLPENHPVADGFIPSPSSHVPPPLVNGSGSSRYTDQASPYLASTAAATAAAQASFNAQAHAQTPPRAGYSEYDRRSYPPPPSQRSFGSGPAPNGHSHIDSFHDRSRDYEYRSTRQHQQQHNLYIPHDWPYRIPPPAVLLDFVNAFFDRIALARRILHRQKFTAPILARLSPPATRPQPFMYHHSHSGTNGSHGHTDSNGHMNGNGTYTPQPYNESFSRTSTHPSTPSSSNPSIDPSLSAPLPVLPGRPLLHAICALAAPFVSARTIAQLFTPASLAGVDLDGDPKARRGIMDSFANDHAVWAKQLSDEDASGSRRLLECVQTTVVLTWHSYLNAKWIDTWNLAGLALRQVIPIGLNDAFDDSYHGHLIDSWRDRALHQGTAPRGAEEVEVRRSVFWLAFMLDIQQAVSTAWPSTLAEQDIGQTMPGTQEDFDFCRRIPTPRQSLESPDLFSYHPAAVTDGFALHIKAVILIGRVARFNSRFLRSIAKRTRARPPPPPSATSNASSGSLHPSSSLPGPPELEYVDPRGSEQFLELENQLRIFRSSLFDFPHFKDYIVVDPTTRETTIDANLYAAHIIPAGAVILLHDPHVDLQKLDCPSANGILDAARYILDTTRQVVETGCDLTLLVHNVAFYWTKAAAVFIRFYGDSLEHGQTARAAEYRVEAEFMIQSVSRITELPCAVSLAQVGNDWLSAASALASSTAPSPDKMWSFLRYSERRRIMLHPAYIGDNHID